MDDIMSITRFIMKIFLAVPIVSCATTPITYSYKFYELDPVQNNRSNVVFDIHAQHTKKCNYVSLSFLHRGSSDIVRVENIPTQTNKKVRIIYSKLMRPGEYELRTGVCSELPMVGPNQPQTSLIGMKYWINSLIVTEDEFLYPGSIVISTNELSEREQKRIIDGNMAGVSMNEALPLNRLPLFESYKVIDNSQSILNAAENDNIEIELDLMSSEGGFVYDNFAARIISQLDN